MSSACRSSLSPQRTVRGCLRREEHWISIYENRWLVAVGDQATVGLTTAKVSSLSFSVVWFLDMILVLIRNCIRLGCIEISFSIPFESCAMFYQVCFRLTSSKVSLSLLSIPILSSREETLERL